MRRVGLLLALFLSVGCLRPSTPPQVLPRIESYFPLAEGNFWKYELLGNGARTVLEFRMGPVEDGPGGEELYPVSATTGVKRSYLRTEGIVGWRDENKVWTIALADPLQVGAQFTGTMIQEGSDGYQAVVPFSGKPPRMVPYTGGGTKQVMSLDREVTVPAGTFRNCVEIRHRQGRLEGVKYFAPGVGLIRAELYEYPRKKGRLPGLQQVLLEFSIQGGGDR